MHTYLVQAFGEERGNSIYAKQQQRYTELLPYLESKTKTQRKTLQSKILPRIALYQVLLAELDSKEATLKTMNDFMTVVAVEMGNSMKKLEHIPLFYPLFRKIASSFMGKSDNWEVDVAKNDKESLAINVTKCLWYEACADHNCPELCPCFCNTDDITYGSLKKINFWRTTSIGYGGEYCDFHFDKR